MSAAPDELSVRVLAAAIAAMPRTWGNAPGRCTATTKRGTQCTRNGESGLEGGAPVCGSHTSEERRQARKTAEREARIRAFQQLPADRQTTLLRRTHIFVAGSPACWSWSAVPPTEDDYRKKRYARLTDEARQCGYSAQALENLWTLDSTVPFDDDAKLSTWQDGRCAVCEEARLELVTDHDHATGLVRGLLCRSCNTREAFSHTPGEGRDVYIAYRKRPPTAILGLTIRYLDPFTGEYAQPARQIADEWDDNAAAGLRRKKD